MGNKFAIISKGQCWVTFTDEFVNLPEKIKVKLSASTLGLIFEKMVLPAITKARQVDNQVRNMVDIEYERSMQEKFDRINELKEALADIYSNCGEDKYIANIVKEMKLDQIQ